MKVRFRACLVVSLVLSVVAALPNAYADTEAVISASINYEQREVRISGTISLSASQVVTITILKPSSPGVNLEDITPNHVPDVVAAAGQAKTDADGNFTYIYKYPEDFRQGSYRVVVGNLGLGIPVGSRSASFYLADEETGKDTISAVNLATAATMGEVLRMYTVDIPVLELELGTQYEAVSDDVHLIMLAVREALPGKTFATVAQIRSAFATALAVGQVNAADEAVLALLLEEKEQQLVRVGAEGYASLDDKSDLCEILVFARNALTNKRFSDDEKYVEVFYTSLSIALVNASDSQSMTQVLENYNDALGLNLQKYAGFDKINVNKALKDRKFKTVGEIQKAFNERIAQLEKTDTDKGSFSTGRPTGGTAAWPVTTQQSETPTVTEPPTSVFNDLAGVPWAQTAINDLFSTGVISRADNGKFEPDRNVTREEFVKMLVLFLGTLDPSATAEFSDVNMNAWYYPYIASACKGGLVVGVSDTHFGVGREITRQDMATILYRAMQSMNMTASLTGEYQEFDDHTNIADYARESVRFVQMSGIMLGVGGNSFAPLDNASRAMAAKVLYEAGKLIK